VFAHVYESYPERNAGDYPIQSPDVSIANRQAEIMMRIASEFGFMPASRSRISTLSKNEPEFVRSSERLN